MGVFSERKFKMSRLFTLMFTPADESRQGVDLLVNLAWEDGRNDLHGVAGARFADQGVTLDCHCGGSANGLDEDAALSALEQHAVSTCAECGGPKPPMNFPRCAPCAF